MQVETVPGSGGQRFGLRPGDSERLFQRFGSVRCLIERTSYNKKLGLIRCDSEIFICHSGVEEAIYGLLMVTVLQTLIFMYF